MRISIIPSFLALAALAGCAGNPLPAAPASGASPAPAVPAAVSADWSTPGKPSGYATFVLKVPQATGLRSSAVSSAAQSFKVSSAGRSVITPLVPGQTTYLVKLQLEIGDNSVDAATYPNPDGTGTAINIGSATVKVVVGQETPARIVLLTLTASLELTAPVNPLGSSGTYQLNLVARDSGGGIITGQFYKNVRFTVSQRISSLPGPNQPTTNGMTFVVDPDVGISRSDEPIQIQYDGQIRQSDPATEVCAFTGPLQVRPSCVTVEPRRTF